MKTPARILRATIENRHGRPTPTEREIAREDRFVAGAQTAFAEHRRDKTTVSAMARALRTSAAMLRHCFCDLDALLAEILHRHLSSLAKAFGEIPYNDPETHRKRRALYLALTRTALGGLTEAHLLLVRDRHLLPAELLTSIDFIRHNLGDILAYGHAEEALDLLDSRYLSAARIEEFVTIITAPEPAEPPIAAAAPLPPAEPPTTPAHAANTLRGRLALALEPPPPDPTNDLYRFGRGFRATQKPQGP